MNSKKLFNYLNGNLLYKWLLSKSIEYRQNRDYIREAKRISNLIRYPININELLSIQKTTNIFTTNQKETEILLILSLLKTMEINYFLEIGTEKGGTLFLFSQICTPKATIISLDYKYPSKAYIKSMKYFSRRKQTIHLIENDSHNPRSLINIKKLLGKESLDFLFIDGDHSYDGVRMDYERYSTLVKPGGIVAFHDIVPDYLMRFGTPSKSNVGGVPLFWQELKAQFPGYKEFVEDSEQDGFGIGLIYK